MSDGVDGKDLASELQRIKNLLTSEGVSSLEDLIAKHHEQGAELERTVKARDKFAEDNNKANIIIGKKGTEHGELLKQVEEIKAERDALQEKIDENVTNSSQVSTVSQKTIDEQLAEIERNLTDEHRTVANGLLEAMTDEEARVVTNDKKTRLKFFTELKDETSVLSKPKSFWPDKVTPEEAETLFKRTLQRVQGVTHGPGGKVPGFVTKATQRTARPQGTLA